MKAATTSVHKEEDYGDALTEEEQQAVSWVLSTKYIYSLIYASQLHGRVYPLHQKGVQIVIYVHLHHSLVLKAREIAT